MLPNGLLQRNPNLMPNVGEPGPQCAQWPEQSHHILLVRTTHITDKLIAVICVYN
jgi:hypothetical protein